MTTALPYILHAVRSAGHVIFTQGAYNLNLIGVRSGVREAGRFDDRLYCVFRNESGEWVERSWAITTDPGLYYLQNPMNVQGTAILCPGQYRGAYVIGEHRGYPALRQDRTLRVWRDNDRDGVLDMDPGRAVEAGPGSGINIHASDSDPFDASDRERTDVGRWSAGCQVFASSKDYREFWDLVLQAAEVWGPRFTYTLIDAPAALGMAA